MDSIRQKVIASVCQQKSLFIQANLSQFDTRLVVAPKIRQDLLHDCQHFEVSSLFDPVTLEPKETFCGMKMVIDKELPDNKYVVEFLIDHQVVKRVKLTA